MNAMNDPKTGSIISVDGNDPVPLHLLPQAANPKFDVNDPHTSSIFRVSFNEFNAMTTAELQNIFKDRHILIYDVPSDPKWKWSLECLEELCPDGIFVEVQGKYMQYTTLYHIADTTQI